MKTDRKFSRPSLHDESFGHSGDKSNSFIHNSQSSMGPEYEGMASHWKYQAFSQLSR